MNKSSKSVSQWIRPLLLATIFLVLPGCSLRTLQANDLARITPEVITIKLKYSNVHLIRSSRPVLIDAGSPMDWALLEEKLSSHGFKPCDIRWVIVTHAHQDHAGLARQFQDQCGTQIAMHQGDLPMAAKGGFDQDLKFTQFMSRIVWNLVDFKYPAFKPNLSWNLASGESVDLATLGLQGRAISVPGHTQGSLAIALKDGRAFIGDMLAGGYLGGALQPTRASEHYFHGDSGRNYRSLRVLLNDGVDTFYLGHGGPLSRISVLNALDRLENKERSDVPIHPTPEH